MFYGPGDLLFESWRRKEKEKQIPRAARANYRGIWVATRLREE